MVKLWNKVKEVKNIRKVGAVMDVARISTKGQVTIPIEIRKKLGLKEGDKVPLPSNKSLMVNVVSFQ